jgi:hypothetical protein
MVKFDYGDAVVTTRVDGEGRAANAPCAVVAITLVDTEGEARTFGYPIGTTLYTVEFGDGSDAILPEDALLPMKT